MRPPDAPVSSNLELYESDIKIQEVNPVIKLNSLSNGERRLSERKRQILSSIENISAERRNTFCSTRSPSLITLSGDSEESDYSDALDELVPSKKAKAESDYEVSEYEKSAASDDSSSNFEDRFHFQKRKRKNRVLPTTTETTQCRYCKEELKTILCRTKPPPKATTEQHILDQNEFIDSVSNEGKAQLQLTGYCVYDEARHLCFFDGDLIQNNINLMFHGYVSHINNETSGTTGKFPVVDAGPINQWWVAGLDMGEDAVIGFSTEIADYYLIEPSVEYAPFVKAITQKILVAKVVFEFLQSKETNFDEMTYTNLLKELETRDLPEGLTSVSEGTLLKYAGFIYGQIKGYGSSPDEEETQLMISSECMKELSKYAENTPLSFTQGQVTRRKGPVYKRQDPSFTKATATFLVANSFSSLFCEQINRSTSGPFNQKCSVILTPLEYREDIPKDFREVIKDWKKRGVMTNLGPCRISNGCQTSALLEHKHIAKNITKPFTIRLNRLSENIIKRYSKERKTVKKETSTKRGKENKRPRYSDDSDFSEDEFVSKKQRKFIAKKCNWVGEPDEISDKCYFQSATVGDDLVKVGTFVTKFDRNEFGQVKYLYEDEDGTMKAHLQWFLSSFDTLLGSCGNSREIFLIEECEDVVLEAIDSIKEVRKFPLKTDWTEFRNTSANEWISFLSQSQSNYFYKQRYNKKYGIFENLERDVSGRQYGCPNCYKQRKLEEREIPQSIGNVEYDNETKMYIMTSVKWRDEEFKLGSSIFLLPGTLREVKPQSKATKPINEVYDEERYPEKYRKNLTHDPDDEECIEPFEIAYICGIYSKKERIRSVRDVRLKVNAFYRPHNTHLSKREIYRLDLNLLYWGDEQFELKMDNIMGKCYVVYEDNLSLPVDQWTENGPLRFYFREVYDEKNQKFVEPLSDVKKIGQFNKKRGGKKTVLGDPAVDWPPVQRPLRTLDVFAGCGGLSEGLHQSGIAESLWAIEKIEAPAKAFSKNFPECNVFVDDCNNILDMIIDGETMKDGLQLPRKGEVELLCGGPPCQGFSRMNRFSHGQYSKFKNSLVVSFVSYCDYFRPKFFVLENVRGFVQSNSNQTIKMTISALVQMGYQVAFIVLQCGAYGIPQNRRRVIILAAAPGEVLPKFPEPTHAFFELLLDVNIDNEKYEPNLRWSTSAPYRKISVYDALSDLPEITDTKGSNRCEYSREPITHFQRQMRIDREQGTDILRDHDCKKLSMLIKERIKHIPTTLGNDWRDLPNIVVKLGDGTYTKKLIYTHNDHKYGKAKNGAFRGVCVCATHAKIKCNKSTFMEYRQSNTIIPWCLPHTSARHAQWSGLYGRVPWEGYFRTVVTNPEPMGKQGRVLHPDQDRVVSVRETARSQGFPDYFKFYGETSERYSQVGNAVAPPLARCIGYEIRKSIATVGKKASEIETEKL